LVEVWNRTYIVIAGAVLMLLLGIVPIHIVFTSYISWNTLFLIAGLYIISNFFGLDFTHWDYFKIAGPLTLLMLVLASLYLSVFFL
jgi:Na+/H+ antiporter NhaD/arsenite permease-like protein